MYGFRRGGSQDLFDRTGQYELIMLMGYWRANSDTFHVYLTNMNARRNLRPTLRSYRPDEVTQVVAQVTHAHTKLTRFNLKRLRALVSGSVLNDTHPDIVVYENQSINQLARIMCELTLVLRNGSMGAGGKGTNLFPSP